MPSESTQLWYLLFGKGIDSLDQYKDQLLWDLSALCPEDTLSVAIKEETYNHGEILITGPFYVELFANLIFWLLLRNTDKLTPSSWLTGIICSHCYRNHLLKKRSQRTGPWVFSTLSDNTSIHHRPRWQIQESQVCVCVCSHSQNLRKEHHLITQYLRSPTSRESCN